MAQFATFLACDVMFIQAEAHYHAQLLNLIMYLGWSDVFSTRGFNEILRAI